MINGHVLNYFITASTFKIQFWKQLIQNRLVFGQDCDTHTQKLSKGLSRVKYICTSLSSTYHKL